MATDFQPISNRPPDCESGFTLVEMIVSLALTLTIGALTSALVSPVVLGAPRPVDIVDQHQRARVAMNVLSGELLVAGAGTDRGVAPGPLAHYLPAVLPRRVGLVASDAPETARPDAVTVLSVPAEAPLLTLQADSTDTQLVVAPTAGCLPSQLACGLDVGDHVVLFDGIEHFDLFRVGVVGIDTLGVQVLSSSKPFHYAAGAVVSRVDVRTFYFDSARRQLRRYDGYQSDVPVVDEVVGVTFEYLGDLGSSRWPQPPAGTANCVYSEGGQPITPVVAAGSHGVATLPLSMLTDGPWCGWGSRRYDADLLRVRQVRVALRFQVPLEVRRGLGAAFASPGVGRDLRVVSDSLIRFVATPRNLNVER